MSKNLSIFNFNNHNVRIQLLKNEPLFCLADVAAVLNIKNVQANRFKLDLRGVHKMSTPTFNQHKAEVKQEMLFINEPNLYRVIFRSNKKEAIDFQNWVFDEVLPTIRKTGSYTLTINSEQQQAIKQAVNQRAYRTGEHYQAIYSKLYNEFKIPRYQDLSASKFNDAINWLGGLSRNAQQITDDEYCDLCWLYKASDIMRTNIEIVTEPLYSIKSEFAPTFHSMGVEYKRTLEQSRRILERLTVHIKPSAHDINWERVLPVIRISK